MILLADEIYEERELPKKLFTRMPAIIRFPAVSLLILLLLLPFDLLRSPKQQSSVKMLVFLVERYQEYVSPHIQGLVRCRFVPSCSSYAIISLEKYGAFKGLMMTIRRLIKCSPLLSARGEDYP